MMRCQSAALFTAALVLMYAHDAAGLAQGVDTTYAATVADTSAFGAILRHVVSDSTLHVAELPLRVDPRPLKSDKNLITVTSESFATISDGELAYRTSVLRAMHLSIGDGVIPPGCTGTMTADYEGSKKGCPAELRRVAYVARPRPGDVVFDRRPPMDPRFSIFRVILSVVGPGGVNQQSRDYVLEPSARGWKIVKMEKLGYWE